MVDWDDVQLKLNEIAEHFKKLIDKPTPMLLADLEQDFFAYIKELFPGTTVTRTIPRRVLLKQKRRKEKNRRRVLKGLEPKPCPYHHFVYDVNFSIVDRPMDMELNVYVKGGEENDE